MVGCLSAGIGAMLVYYHMEYRASQRKEARFWLEIDQEPYVSPWSIRASDWLSSVLLPAVVVGATLAIPGWLVIVLPLWGLGIVH
jgi:hypothetical protein